MRVILCAIMLAILLPSVGFAQTQGGETQRTWPEEKCFRYGKAWNDVLQRWGTKGVSSEFLSSHNAFIEGGCSERANVCPRSDRELEFANILSIAAINAGITGSFLPFACRD